MIHKSSIIDSKANISKKAKIGPFCILGPNVTIEDNVELISKFLTQYFSCSLSGTLGPTKRKKIYVINKTQKSIIFLIL